MLSTWAWQAGREAARCPWTHEAVTAALTCSLSLLSARLRTPPLRFRGPVIGKYSQHPDSGEPRGRAATLSYCSEGRFQSDSQTCAFPFLSLPAPFAPRVAAEVGRRLDTTRIHLSSVPPASRKPGCPLPFASGLHAALAPSPGSSRQCGPAQPRLLRCRASGTRPRSVGGLADRRQGKPPTLHVNPPSPQPWPRGLLARCPCTQHGCA